MERRGKIRIGCSGWNYRHWRGVLYPEDLPVSRWLERYAERFSTVEVNNSFYRLPTLEAVHVWKETSPEGFVFAWKASRFLTHQKKLNQPEEAVARMFSSARGLGEKLGPVLYQLPPRWGANPERLRGLFSVTPRGVRQALEVRDPSWYSPEVARVLAEAGVALCLHDMPGSATPRPERAPGPFVYVRFHGAGATHEGGYDRGVLEGWASWLLEQASEGLDVFVYFNNDLGGHAVLDALRLREAVERRAPHGGRRAGPPAQRRRGGLPVRPASLDRL